MTDPPIFWLLVSLIFPVLCILFAEPLSHFVSYRIKVRSPAWLIRVAGLIMILALAWQFWYRRDL